MQKTLIAAVLAAASAAAWADGVPLFLTGKAPAPTPEQSQRYQRMLAMKTADGAPAFIAVTPILVNESVMGANVIDVTVDGKTYSVPKRSEEARESADGSKSWYGQIDGATLSLSSLPKEGVFGSFVTPTRGYNIRYFDNAYFLATEAMPQQGVATASPTEPSKTAEKARKTPPGAKP